MIDVTDDYGLVNNNEHLTVYFPYNNKAMVFRVVSRYNAGFEKYWYGNLPLAASTVLSTYDGSSATVAAYGRLNARAYVTGLKFANSDTWDTTDQWFVPYTWNNRIFHSKLHVTPSFLRLGVQIPSNVNQQRFQREEVVGGADLMNGVGYTHGDLELIHFPEVHYGYVVGNDTNLAIDVRCSFTYGEYIVEVPSNPEVIFGILQKLAPSYWFTMPMTSSDQTMTQGLKKTWGFDGFTLYPLQKKAQAIEDYRSILTSKDVVAKGVLG